MLKKLMVKGFKGFKEELIIDLSNTRSYDFNNECVKNNIVNKSIIYGKNASGKSNIGYAIFDIVSNLTDKNNGNILYNNYINAENKNGIAYFKYTFEFNGIEVQYNYSKKSLEEILEEELIINGQEEIEEEKINQRVVYYNFINRGFIETSLAGTENLDKNFNDMNISVLKYIYKNSKLENNDINTAFELMMSFVNNMLFFRCLNSNTYIGFRTGSKDVLEDIVENNYLAEFESFLNEEGVVCSLTERSYNGKKTIAFKIGDNEIDFAEIASTGTNSLALFFYWYKNLANASFLFIDEFDAFYHFDLSEKIVNKLKELNVQTILTTHNTYLLNNELLRPDCYFIIFDNSRIKPLFELTDRELRYGHNLEKIFRAEGFKE